MTIAAILNDKGRNVEAISSGRSVRDAIALLAERRIGALPVIDDGEVKGVFSERDVIYALAADGAGALDKNVGAVMTAPAVTVAPRDAALGALSLMTRRRIRHLPVIEDGRIVGLVSIGDVVKYRIERIEADASAMRDYIQSA
jgi:CBS domain-containing protein